MVGILAVADALPGYGERSLALGDRSLAHDIRRPLAALSLCVELLLDGRGSDSALADQLMDTMRRNAKLLMELVSSEPLPGQASDESEVDLSIVAAEVAEACQGWIARRGQRLTVELPDASVIVTPPRADLVRAIMNLVDNASKFGADGDVLTLRVRRQGDHAMLSVHDHGPAERNGGECGHGIGLAVVGWVVGRAGGRAGLERHGDETVAWLTLPIVAAPAPRR